VTGHAPGEAEHGAESGGVSSGEPASTERRDRHQARPRSFARELPRLLAIALIAAFLLKTLVVQAFYVPSPSMVPTLMPNDRILVNRLTYRFGDIHRQDVVVFTGPSEKADRGVVGGFLHWLVEGIGLARPASEDFVKRVIGLPGDTVEIDANGTVFVNGSALHEPYLNRPPDTRAFGPITVPAGMLFVLGDNRAQSGDSRFPPPSGVGYVPTDRVVGKAFVKVWPPSRVGWIR